MPTAEKDAPRVKVACINWSHADAPHALIYLLRNGEAVAEQFVDTWADAMALVPRYARLIPPGESRAR